MDASRFDLLARTISARTRRGIVAALVSVPMALLAMLFDLDAIGAKRRKRGKQRGDRNRRVGADNHKHEHRRRKHNLPHKHKRKKKKKHGHACEPDSFAQTCDGRCGDVINNCDEPVDCGSCECNPECLVCHICNAETGECQPDAEQVDQDCGGGRVCQEDGSCACSGDSCGAGFICDGESGECIGCGGSGETCCDGDACGSGLICTSENLCAPCGGAGDLCCEGGECGNGLVCGQDDQCVSCGGSGEVCCAGSSCDTGFLCDGQSGMCEACGGNNETCCAGDICGTGLICGNGDFCEPCGGEDQPCCASQECDGDLICHAQSGTCQDSCFCEDPACFLVAWGSQGPGNSEFMFNTDAAVAPNGNVYVVDASNHNVQYFDADGTRLGGWGGPAAGSGPGEFNTPFGIAISPDGNRIYVVDSNNDRVQIFSPDGTPQGQFGSSGPGLGQFAIAHRIAVSPDGARVYVSDSDGANVARIQVFTATGTPIEQWGVNGTAPGEFDHPFGIAVSLDGNRVYVADTNNENVQIFSPSGVFQGALGSGVGQLSNPIGVAVGLDGNVFVTDLQDNHVQIFDANGTHLGTFGSVGGSNGKFNTPWGIAVGPNGTIYVADSNNHRMQAFCPNLD
jgi:DNA-binding beta-propeller fold protein YncE